MMDMVEKTEHPKDIRGITSNDAAECIAKNTAKGAASSIANGILNYAVVAYLLLMSGSVLQILHMTRLQTVNICVTLAAFALFLLLRFRRGSFSFNLNVLFLLTAAGGALFVMTMSGETHIYTAYLSNVCLLLMPYIISQLIGYGGLKRAYINTMLLLAALSLLCFHFPAVLNLLPVRHVSLPSREWSYDLYGLYARFTSEFGNAHLRNTGVFWEPGMYQGFLIFAMLLTCYDQTVPRHRRIFYQIIFALTVLSTQSATGYVLLIAMGYICFLQALSRWPQRWRIVAVAASLLLLAAFLLIPGGLYRIMAIFSQSSAEKLAGPGNLSRDTRLYGMLADVQLALRHPFGVGQLAVDALRAKALTGFGVATDGANINTSFTMMLYFGLIPGALFLLINARACYHLARDWMGRILSFLIMMVIINTEPHYLTLLFTTFFFYLAAPQNRRDAPCAGMAPPC